MSEDCAALVDTASAIYGLPTFAHLTGLYGLGFVCIVAPVVTVWIGATIARAIRSIND